MSDGASGDDSDSRVANARRSTGEAARALAAVAALGSMGGSLGGALANRKVPGSIPALVRLADARPKRTGGSRNNANNSYGTAAAAALAAAARASPEFAGKLLRLDALDVMRDALADDATSPARASAALSALVALVSRLCDPSAPDGDPRDLGGLGGLGRNLNLASTGGTNREGDRPPEHEIGGPTPAGVLAESGLVAACAVALDPARPGVVAARARLENFEDDFVDADADAFDVDADADADARAAAFDRDVAATTMHAARLLHLPFTHPLPAPGTTAASLAEDALRRYQETLLSEAVVAGLVQAIDGLRGDDLAAPAQLLSQLVLRSSQCARQFLEAGGLDEGLVRGLLAPQNPAAVLVDSLLAVSQLARLSQRHYPAIARAGVCDRVGRLLTHDDPGVRARTCNLLGNMCRHSGYFYERIARRGVLNSLIDRCEDVDRTTRKFACFAIGNAGFHSDALYPELRVAVPPLVRLLGDEEDKTRANAAAALGNLVRNSAALCGDLIRAGALERLVELATGPEAAAEAAGSGGDGGGGGGDKSGGDGQSPLKIALFSLGNLCTHRECRELLLAQGFELKVEALAGSPDAAIRKYVARVLSKIRG